MKRKVLLASALALALAAPATARAENLDRRQFSEARDRLVAAVRASDVSSADAAIRELSSDDSWRAAELLLEVAVQITGERLFSSTRDALGRIQDADARERMARMLERGATAWQVRVLLCDVLASRQEERTRTAIVSALDDRNEAVRRAAVNALRNHRDRSVVAALVDALEREERSNAQGVIHRLIRETLTALTGHDHATAVDWRAFWNARGGSFDFARDRGGSRAAETHQRDVPRFFGSEIRSTRIVFVIDVSGSMQAEDPGTNAPPPAPPPDPRQQTGRQGGGNGGASGPAAPPPLASRVRIDRAKYELANAIRALPAEARFTVIAYAGAGNPPSSMTGQGGQGGGQVAPDEQWLHVFSRELVPAARANLERALQFVDQLRADGMTFTLKALRRAFQVEGADTIILLSDGMPTEWTDDGGEVAPQTVLDEVETLNRFRRLTIDTFGFDGTGQMPGGMAIPGGELSAFMRDLAQRNGGEFHPIR